MIADAAPRRFAGPLLSVLAAVAAVALVAGCDTTDRLSKAQYVAELRQVANEIREDSDLPGQFLAVGSVEELGNVVERAVEELRELVAKLDDIEPPDEVAAIHDRLTDALGKFTDLFERARAALSSENLLELIDIAPKLNQIKETFNHISADFAQRGYEFLDDVGQSQ